MMLQVKEGDMIVQEGEMSLDMYKLVSGKAEMYVGYGTERETFIGILSKGDYFGEMGLLARRPAIYTIVMYSDGLLLRITPQDIVDYIKNNERDILSIMVHMANSMYNLKTNIDLLTEDINEMIHEKKNEEEIKALQERIRASRLTKEFLMRNKV